MSFSECEEVLSKLADMHESDTEKWDANLLSE